MLTLAVTFGPTLLTAKARTGAGSELIYLDSALEPSDAELARRAGGGDRWAEEAFYRRHVLQVVGLAQRLLGNSWDAEDVAQETFIAAFQLWGQLRDLERARSWLMQIAVRQVHRKFRKRRLLRLLGLDRGVDDLPLEALARDDTAAEVRSELMVLESVLKSMPPKRKIAWMLRYVEGLPLEEVAQQCDCSLATAKRRVAAAQRLVSRQLEITRPADD
jgi:RNA polymerase sigma-70 factor, ECF subfamily